MTTALAVIVDATIVTALALLVCRALRHRPASLRHMILAASLGAAALAPALEATLPPWELPLLASTSVTSSGLTLESEQVTDPAAEAVATTPAPRLTWIAAFAAAWGIGAFVVLAGLIAGVVRLMSLTRRCQPIQARAWRERTAALSIQNGLVRPVAVLECPDRALLLTWGLFKPRIIVPADAASWTRDRIDVVLAHELAHIVRRDWALQILAESVRAVYWFNPLVWITCRQLRDESEQACDDAVLRRGLNPVDYASHLLAVARHLLADGRTWASAPAVADPSTLERRVAAMLTVSRNRQPLTRTAAAFALAGMFAVALPLAAVTLTERRDPTTVVAPARSDIALVAPEPAAMLPAKPLTAPRRALPRAAAAAAPQAPSSVAGKLSDASGAMLPGVQLTLTNTVSGTSSSTTSDASGSFVFRDVAPSRYQLVARLPGFATALNELTVASAENLQRNMTLRVGSLNETVTVTCGTGAASVASASGSVVGFVLRTAVWGSRALAPVLEAQQAPVRIGGQIAAPRRIKDAKPECPAVPIGSGASVVLEATVGADGLIADVKVVRNAPERPEFAQAAIEAVRQWEYTPTRLNNVPVPVVMAVTVVFATQ